MGKKKKKIVMSAGETHGRLTFIEYAGFDEETHSIGRFVCSCGANCIKRLARVRNGNTRSCGCLWFEVRGRR